MKAPEFPILRRPGIAVVPFYEIIRGGARGARYVDLFKRLRKDGRVRAVVLDIDSPGGEVTASDSLYRAARRLRQEKPVVAFFRGVGASGAYLLACAGSTIVAVPSAMVGSIGVISIRPLAPQLLERVGIQFAVSKTGPYKDSGAFYRVPTEEEDARRQALIDDFYAHFLDVIALERKLPRDTVRALATGEVFWAWKARDLGLVDELGDLEDAVERAAALAQVAPRSFTARPVRPLPQRLLGAAAHAVADEVNVHVESALARYRL